MRLGANLLIVVMLAFGWAVEPAWAATQSLGDFGGVNDHPHNLSSISTAAIHAADAPLVYGEDQICVYCHAPHGASSDGPLWNRNDPAGPFSLYGNLGNTSIDEIAEAKYPDAEYPNGASRLCLSCHDGVTAIGTTVANGVLDATMSMSANGTIDLSKSHPISFVYSDAVVSALQGAPYNKINYQKPAVASKVTLDDQERMQCTTCHDPHVDTNDGVYMLPMWANYSGVENNDYNDTCNECHGAGTYSGGPGDPHAW